MVFHNSLAMQRGARLVATMRLIAACVAVGWPPASMATGQIVTPEDSVGLIAAHRSAWEAAQATPPVIYDHHTYLPTISRPQPADCLRYEPNDTADTATGPVDNGDTIYAAICSGDLQDVFYFDLIEYSSVKITLDQIPSNTNYDLYVYFYYPLLGRLYETGASTQYGTTPEEITKELDAGHYLIEIWPMMGHSAQAYRLKLEWSQATAPPETWFDGPWEQEPNNKRTQANGLLRSGQLYQGYPNDAEDWFKIATSAAGTISVDLENHVGSGIQLLLYDVNSANLVQVYQEPFQINYVCNEGEYYIRIYTESDFTNSVPYSLRVTYP